MPLRSVRQGMAVKLKLRLFPYTYARAVGRTCDEASDANGDADQAFYYDAVFLFFFLVLVAIRTRACRCRSTTSLCSLGWSSPSSAAPPGSRPARRPCRRAGGTPCTGRTGPWTTFAPGAASPGGTAWRDVTRTVSIECSGCLGSGHHTDWAPTRGAMRRSDRNPRHASPPHLQ